MATTSLSSETNHQWACDHAVEWLAVVALLLTFLLRYSPFLASRLLYGPFGDDVHIYGPIFSEVSKIASAGSVPYYLPSIGIGFPMFKSAHFSILYPLYFFGLIKYGGPLASLYTLTNLTLLHILFFYFNLYLLLRCATVTPWAAYIGASVGFLAPNTLRYATWLPLTASCAWLPLLLGGAVLLVRGPGKATGVIVFSAAAGLLTLACPTTAIQAAFICLMLFATAVAWLSVRHRFKEGWLMIRSVVFCCIIVLGLTGAAILPIYLSRNEMIRHISDIRSVIGFEQIPWSDFTAVQLTLSQAIGIVLRPVWISIVGSPYIGPLGLVGVLLTGIYFHRLDLFVRMLAIAFGVIGFYGLFSSFGSNLGFAYINYRVPMLNQIREAGRHLLLFVIGVSFLSGIGFSVLPRSFKHYKQSRNARQLIPAAILLLIFSAIILWELFQNYRRYPNFWMLPLAPALFILGRICRSPGYKNVAIAAILVSAAALVVPTGGVPQSSSSFNQPMNLRSHRVIQSLLSKIDAQNYRVDFRDTRFSKWLWAMNASYYGIKSFYNQLTPQPYDRFRFSLGGDVPHLRELMGARYVVCSPNESPIDRNSKQILETEGYRLYENSHAMGRLTVVHRIAGPAKTETEFLSIVSKGFDYFSQAYVAPEDFNAVWRYFSNVMTSGQSGDRITELVNEANRCYSEVNSDSPSLVILNEWFTPAWKVQVNGKRQPALRVNQWQTGVLLPPGKNRVEFEYRPILFQLLMVLNRLTLVLLAVSTILLVTQKASK